MDSCENRTSGEGSGDCVGEGRVSAAELQGIMDRIRSRVEEQQVQAAFEIRRLTKTSSRNRRHFSPAVEPLVLMLRSGSSQSAEAAILGLLNLAAKDERCGLWPFPSEKIDSFDLTALTAEEGGVLAVVEILEDGSLRSREHAVGAVLTLCESDRSRYREVILKEGAIPGLLELTVQGTPKSEAKARRLLELLRDSPGRRSELQAEMIECT
ncbi:hypothetical protein GW17_00060034 [Ensete ventricosum]|nr:hypothetical protein GW17_00060034 [Ensete ventricosum]